MSLERPLTGTVAIVFILRFSNENIRSIFESEGFQFRTGGPPFQVAPGVSFGPEPSLIAEREQISIEYVQHRLIFRVKGNIEHLNSGFREISDIFDRYGYNFSENVRYYEFDLGSQPIDLPRYQNVLRNEINLGRFEALRDIFGCDFKVFNFSVSYPSTPQSDEWLHIQIHPDALNPMNRFYIRITKRTETLDDMSAFTLNLPRRIDRIKTLLGG